MVKKINLCIVTTPLNPAGLVPLSNFIKLAVGLANQVYVVTGGAAQKMHFAPNIQVKFVDRKSNSKVLFRIINFIITQLKILCNLVMISQKIDVFIFSLGGEGLFFSLMVLKILRKKILLVPGGLTTKVYSVQKDVFYSCVRLLIHLSFNVTDKLVLYSRRLISEGNLYKYKHKIIIAHEHFINFEKFKMTTHYNKRPELVGYLGRLSGEKGILNFIKAIPLVLKEKSTTGFMVCGDGKLYDEVIENIAANRVSQNVKLIKWIKHEEVPIYLNSLKLLVVPSFTEGLPNVILEAMACGTPVLATPVGAITDIIKEGETGFLLKSNTPLNIAKQIIILLNKPALLEKVSKNAYDWVRLNFSEEQTIETWRKILQDLNANNK